MRFSPAQLIGAAALALSVAVAGVAFRAHEHAALSSAQAAADTARVALQAETARAAHADSVAAAGQEAADSAAAHEQAAKQHADSASTALAVLRERYRASSAIAPDTCRVVIALADSALATADSSAQALRSALAAGDARAAALQVGLDTTRAALVSLRASAQHSVAATAALIHAAKPSLGARLVALLPRVGVGGAAGLGLDGRPDVVAGVTLGWAF